MSSKDATSWIWQVGVDLHSLTEDSLGTRNIVSNSGKWQPRVDLMEVEESLLCRVELAGVRLQEIGLQYNIDKHTLTIRGLRSEDEADHSATYHQLEIPFGEFQRVVVLPKAAIDPEKIRAQYRNGFLYVELPKRPRIFVTTMTITEF